MHTILLLTVSNIRYWSFVIHRTLPATIDG